jgi:2Fe-2S ferredoxin
MASLTVIDRSGQTSTVTGNIGASVMEVIRDNGFDDLQALCGGCCSCATCHIHVAEPFLSKLAPISDDESDLLDSSSHRDDSSRLSCQIVFTAELDGMTVTIAKED